MENTQQTILKLLKDYEDVVQKAKELELISTKSFVGDIIETLVCNEINAEKCDASQKGYDAIRKIDNKDEHIQIKYRSKNSKEKYKITFKNVTQSKIGFDTLAFCCQTEKGYKIYEIKVEDFIHKTQFKRKNKRRVLFLDESFLESDKTKKHEIKRC